MRLSTDERNRVLLSLYRIYPALALEKRIEYGIEDQAYYGWDSPMIFIKASYQGYDPRTNTLLPTKYGSHKYLSVDKLVGRDIEIGFEQYGSLTLFFKDEVHNVMTNEKHMKIDIPNLQELNTELKH